MPFYICSPVSNPFLLRGHTCGLIVVYVQQRAIGLRHARLRNGGTGLELGGILLTCPVAMTVAAYRRKCLFGLLV